MRRSSIPGLPYFLGITSLDQIASPDDAVAVLNALGGESRTVTPISHAYSGGNVVFGVSPGRSGQVLETPGGGIPIYNTVRDGLNAGHRFNTGVVYLPPSGVRDGVAELIRVNKELQKIVIITEKISVHDAREIRAIAQANHVDIIGGNCLGVADSWNRVRIGGALGGDNPAEVLRKGSVALFSNSGGFTTTIAQYLATGGWGTTTLISSGKDVYIHYSARDFARAFRADARSKAAVLYVEPGGYYEQNLEFDKPVVACVVGRWKSKLTRAVGHAGAMGGSGDSAEDKERWFMEIFGTKGIFTPNTPHASAKGALVTSIADIPLALNHVMALNDEKPDFLAKGTLALKPWMSNTKGIDLPNELDKPVQPAPAPYDDQVIRLSEQLGASIARQNMKDCSGATVMDTKTQITSVHGTSVLTLAETPLAAVYALPFSKEIINANAQALLTVAILAEDELADKIAPSVINGVQDAGNPPNMAMIVAAALMGSAKVASAKNCCEALLRAFANSGLIDVQDPHFDLNKIELADPSIFRDAEGPNAGESAVRMLNAIKARNASSVFLTVLERLEIPLSRDAILAAIAMTVMWGPFTRKRITQLSLLSTPWYIRLYGAMLSACLPLITGTTDRPIPATALSDWSIEDLCFQAIAGRRPNDDENMTVRSLIGLLISNGPGAISAQGAKGAVSADGPQTPERVQINKAMIGFLTHTGFSHGGNGFEGIAFLLDIFSDYTIEDPNEPNHGLDLDAIATKFARQYKQDKKTAKELGEQVPAIPGIHHPVFRGKSENFDPRERYVAALQNRQGRYNIFHDFYLKLAQAIHREGASSYVFCVNIDAIIAASLLSVMWSGHRNNLLSTRELENAAFNIFLFGRMVGATAEIDDHLNRGRNMDTRTKASNCTHVV